MSAPTAADPVARDYRHGPKLAQPGPPLALGGTVLKWYEIAPADRPVPGAIRELAREDLLDAAQEALDLSADLGFVILHRCGASFYFLLVSTWRNDNELWETVWAKNGDEDPAFGPWPVGEGHHPTFCVWELGAVDHERRAWSRYLRSARDESARQAYLDDTFAGEV